MRSESENCERPMEFHDGVASCCSRLLGDATEQPPTRGRVSVLRSTTYKGDKYNALCTVKQRTPSTKLVRK